MLLPPLISNTWPGFVVPIPTLPLESILNLSDPAVDIPRVSAVALKIPVDVELVKAREGLPAEPSARYIDPPKEDAEVLDDVIIPVAVMFPDAVISFPDKFPL